VQRTYWHSSLGHLPMGGNECKGGVAKVRAVQLRVCFQQKEFLHSSKVSIQPFRSRYVLHPHEPYTQDAAWRCTSLPVPDMSSNCSHQAQLHARAHLFHQIPS
jgi:hypothetical protein